MITVSIAWERRPRGRSADRLRRVVAGVCRRQGVINAEVHLCLTSDAAVRALNHQWRGLDRATDVLSFPLDEQLPDGRLLLGEVVVSMDRAREQARDQRHDEIRELEELVLHGTLHLLGLDHEADDGTMDKLELELREELL